MNKVKALIVEDNPFMATLLRDLLRKYADELLVTDIAQTGEKAFRLITSKVPDILFLDVELPDMTGFDLLARIPDISFKTIFTTSHSHYAIKAFRFNALDYLVKPIKEEELHEAINRYKTTSSNIKNVKNALSNLESKFTADQKLILSTQKGMIAIVLKNITYIEGERNYSYIHLLNGKKELSSKNLAHFEDILQDKDFFRCHRSFLINRYHIAHLEDNQFVLRDKTNIPISRRRKTLAKEWYYQ